MGSKKVKGVFEYPNPKLKHFLRLCTYQSNKYVATSVQWFNSRCFHSYLHEPCNLSYDHLHDAKVVTDGDKGAKENDCWKNLQTKQHDISMWPTFALTSTSAWGPFLESPENFRVREVIRKTPTRLFCKAGLFTWCKGKTNQNNCKVSCPGTPSLSRYKENHVTGKVSRLSRNGPL